jgi:NhaP-type Na+/H+ or K+/H+ antiporter
MCRFRPDGYDGAMTGLVLTFGVALLLAVATSDLASRSPLSSTTVFLTIGLVAGPLGLDVIDVDGKFIEGTAVVALYTILFTDGLEAPVHVLRRHWRPSAGALLVGLPLTLVLIAALAHYVTGLPWAPALVLGAVLAPTDPVFASALVGRHDVPEPVRGLINIESGVNDGLALPAVLLLIGIAGGNPEGRAIDLPTLALQLAMGVALGIAVPLAAWTLYRAPHLGTGPVLRPLGHLAVAVILFGLCDITDANPFLAAFAAGSTLATLQTDATEAFRRTGERLSELLQGAALLAFAGLLGHELFSTAGLAGFVFAVLVIAVSRPLPVFAVLARSGLTVRQRMSVSWFGPKGFASVAYAAIVAFSGMDHAKEVLALAAVTVLVSALAHSSTDLFIAEKLAQEEANSEDTPARGDAA